MTESGSKQRIKEHVITGVIVGVLSILGSFLVFSAKNSLSDFNAHSVATEILEKKNLSETLIGRIAKDTGGEGETNRFIGPKGEKGDPGSKGEKGDKGDKGDPGKDGTKVIIREMPHKTHFFVKPSDGKPEPVYSEKIIWDGGKLLVFVGGSGLCEHVPSRSLGLSVSLVDDKDRPVLEHPELITLVGGNIRTDESLTIPMRPLVISNENWDENREYFLVIRDAAYADPVKFNKIKQRKNDHLYVTAIEIAEQK